MNKEVGTSSLQEELDDQNRIAGPMILEENALTYLDANSTTPMSELSVRAFKIVNETNAYGNEASDNWAGMHARDRLDGARNQVAEIFHASSKNVVFCSSATEALNTLILGRVRKCSGKPHVVTTNMEHAAVRVTLRELEKDNQIELTTLKADEDGRIAPEQVRSAVRDDTALVIVIHGNNEVGTVNDVAAISRQLEGSQAMFIVDAAQTGAFLAPDVSLSPRIDAVVISAHKMHGPKGVAAYYVRKPELIRPLLYGGGQEMGLRAGTSPVPLICCFAVACQEVNASGVQKVMAFRQAFYDTLIDTIGDATEVRLIGDPDLRDPTKRLPSNLSLCIDRLDYSELRQRVPTVAISQGSACGARGDSSVLRALGLSVQQRKSTIRVGFHRDLSETEVVNAATLLGDSIRKITRLPRGW